MCILSNGVERSMSARVGLSVEVPPSEDGSVEEKRKEKDGEGGLKSNQGSNGENYINTPQETRKRTTCAPNQSPRVSRSDLHCFLLRLFLRLPDEVISYGAGEHYS